MTDPRWRRLARVRSYCNSSCIGSIGFGAAILLGRAIHVEALEAVLPGSSAIQTNAALGLIFLGISLRLLLPDPPRRRNRNIAWAFAGLALLTGAITLIEFIFRVDLHVDQLLLREQLTSFSPHFPPGRMSPSAAMMFLGLGLSLLLLDWETDSRRRPAQRITLWAGLFATMTLSGYIYGAHAIYKVFSYTQGSAYLGLVLLIMSGAVFFARPRVGIAGDLTGRFLGSAMARRFLPGVLIVPFLMGWLRQQGLQARWYSPELGLALNTTVTVAIISVMVWYNARDLNLTEESLEEVREAGNVHFDASVRDELTGLYNRRGFLTFAEEQIELACSGRRELLVVFADVDGLKAINDGFGHLEGDRALKKAAELLLTVFRDTDVVARLGGDEFAVLALDCSTVGLYRINAHIDKMLREMNDRDAAWKLSISIGTIHVDAQHQLSINDLLSEADKLMYERKRSRLVAAVR
jgi:diguanylate cyclase (GGDEF)-like protein